MFSFYADGELLYSTEAVIDDRVLFNLRGHSELNKTGSISFTMQPNHPLYSSIEKMRTIIEVYEDEEEIPMFRGRVLDISENFYEEKTIQCEGDMSFLLDTLQPEHEMTSTKSEFLSYILSVHNSQIENYKQFQLGNVDVDDPTMTHVFKVRKNARTSDAIDNSLSNMFGGFLSTRFVNGVAYLDYSENVFGTDQKDISFGINLIDMSSQFPVSNHFTILKPLGENDLTIASVNDGSEYLVDDAAVQKYGKIYGTISYSNVTSAEELLKYARLDLAKHTGMGPYTRDVSAIDLHYLQPEVRSIHLGDPVLIESEPHNLSDVLYCLAIDYDFQNVENNKYKLGLYIGPDSTGKEVRTGASLTSITHNESVEMVDWENEFSGDFEGLQESVDELTEKVDKNTDDIESNSSSIGAISNRVSKNEDDIVVNARNITATAEQLINLTAENIKMSASSSITVATKLLNITADEIKMEAGGSSTVKSTIKANEKGIETLVEKTGTGRLSDGETLYSKITQNESNISLEAVRAQNKEQELSASINVNANAITSKVSKGDIASEINQTAQSVLIRADKINLDGYVKTEALEAAKADIGRQISDSVTTDSLTVYNGTRLNSLTVEGTLDLSSLTLRNGSVLATRSWVQDEIAKIDPSTDLKSRYIQLYSSSGGWEVLSSSSEDPINLIHYHRITADSSGTVTVGAPTATQSSATFNIADTNFYKNAVASARANGVAEGEANMSISGILATPTGSLSYDHTLKRVSRDFVLLVTHGSGDDQTTLYRTTKKFTLDDDDAYTYGADSVSASSITQGSGSITWSSTRQVLNAPILITLSSGKTKTLYTDIDASKAYNAGYSAGSSGVSKRTVSSVSVSSTTKNWTTNKYTVYLLIAYDDGETLTKNVTVDVSDAINRTTISSLVLEKISERPAASAIQVRATATASNGKIKSATEWYYISS